MTPLTLDSEQQIVRQPQQRSSVCGCCQFYKFQGRSGGHCHRLGVPVRSHWRTCPLALSAFAPSWEGSSD